MLSKNHRATLYLAVIFLLLVACDMTTSGATDSIPTATGAAIEATATLPTEPPTTTIPLDLARIEGAQRLLAFVPDIPENRLYVSYGDAAAWHESWNVPRLHASADYDRLPPLERQRFSNQPSQTDPPPALNVNYFRTEDARPRFGFSWLSLDRYLYAGRPPETINVAEFAYDRAEIDTALTSEGYTAASLGDGAILYRNDHDDYEVDLSGSVMTRLGDFNRIAVLDGQLIIAKASSLVEQAFQTAQGEQPSLADAPTYQASLLALADPLLADSGVLVGIIWQPPEMVGDASLYQASSTSADPTHQLEQYEQAPLPAYDLVALATSHRPGASFLTLVVVFPEGVDAEAAAAILADRLQNYTSLAYRTTLEERWTFDRSTGVTAAGRPVALVVMRVDDPAPEEGQFATVFNWLFLLNRRDLLFLVHQ